MTRKTLILGILFAGLIGCGGGAGDWSSGDRVLVTKWLYDTGVVSPHRFDVVVFKYPETPVERGTPKNYIKRLIGLPGEIIAIFFGRLYRWDPDGQPPPFRKQDDGIDVLNLWRRENVHDNDRDFARKQFELGESGRFKIIRKPPDVLMALRRIVYDNDYQPSDLVNMVKPRWNPDATQGWLAAGGKGLAHKGDTPTVGWLRYQHLVVERSDSNPPAGVRDVKPRLITDRLGYNSFTLEFSGDMTPAPNWVGDLMLECNIDVQKAQGEFIMELSKSIYRYQARWNLVDGTCSLYRIGDGKEEKLDSKVTRVKGPGSFMLRFANVDARLTVWIDRELPFDEGFTYTPPEVWAAGEREQLETKIRQTEKDDERVAKLLTEHRLDRRGPTENDLQPASIGSNGASVVITHLRLWRDTYYTMVPQGPDYADRNGHGAEAAMPRDAWSDPSRWEPLKKLDYRSLYVQPGHYLCLGDNSTASSDSRDWGLVPQRLLLGRALAVYYPIHRLGPIR